LSETGKDADLTVGANSLFKLDNRNQTRLGSIKHKVHIPEYIFSLLPLQSRPIWLLYQSRLISIVQLK